MPDKLTVDSQPDGRIFLLNNGLVVFIARTREAIDAFVKTVFPHVESPEGAKNDWTARPGPFWR